MLSKMRQLFQGKTEIICINLKEGFTLVGRDEDN